METDKCFERIDKYVVESVVNIHASEQYMFETQEGKEGEGEALEEGEGANKQGYVGMLIIFLLLGLVSLYYMCCILDILNILT